MNFFWVFSFVEDYFKFGKKVFWYLKVFYLLWYILIILELFFVLNIFKCVYNIIYVDIWNKKMVYWVYVWFKFIKEELKYVLFILV